VPFFLQTQPALATGRGERIVPLDPFPALQEAFILLIHPGFGISAAWAYEQLAHFPEALQGARGRGEQLIALLRTSDLPAAGPAFYNALEAPALRKYPLLALFQDFLRANGAGATLLSGSGSATFALVHGRLAAERLAEQFRLKFGNSYWLAVLAL
jgi:4-diphosphocytidyl-2-C-methyl-D-erythritol kinase